MSSISARLRSIPLPRKGLRSLKSQGVVLENAQALYDCGKLAWWARWTYFLVLADLVVTASACELTLNHWTMWEELPKDSATPTTLSSGEHPVRSTDVVGHYVTRPLWQRSLFTLANFAGGVGLAAVLLGGRSRIVRKMFIVPSAASQATSATAGRLSDRLLVIQSPLHTKSQGVVMPLNRTRLIHSPEKTEMLIGLKDRRGHYSLGLQGAVVDGQKMSIWDARKSLFTTWYGEKRGMQMFLASAKVKEESET
ncbi:hypothetical protein VTO73DRAFT_2179 [Trametes versicolor]